MFLKNWMSYISDDAKITKLAMPGSHNSGTMGMSKLAKCQNGSLYEQYAHGVRAFDIRLKADKKGRLFIGHGIMTGMPAELAFESLKMILNECGDEFFVISMITYMNQKIGPFKLSYNGNSAETSRLIREYLSPEKYALTDYGDINELTLGDIRKSGKKYIIINGNKEYDYSVDCPYHDPWNSYVYGYKPEKFAKEILKYITEKEYDGFVRFQTQQTPNPGTENGWSKWPDDLDDMIRPYFNQIIDDVAADPEKLEKINIIGGDFMCRDNMKANKILSLNLLKGMVKEELKNEYKEAISSRY
ncbi:MAG: hypothetical protein IKK63_07750 [Clostridia bacterium]|nr:hypothetical protein [Clostridia bacterium]